MDGKKLGNSLESGMDTLQKLALGLGGLIMTIVITLLIVGVTTNVATSGDITVSSGVNTSLAASETSLTTGVTAITGNLSLIFSLVALVVILGVLGWFVFGKKSGSGKADY